MSRKILRLTSELSVRTREKKRFGYESIEGSNVSIELCGSDASLELDDLRIRSADESSLHTM